jgi:hypothetical protein
MLSQRQDQRQSEPEYTAEDVERLARDFMGWDKHVPGSVQPQTTYFRTRLACPDRQTCMIFPAGPSPRAGQEWNPFLSADADLQVLERAREVYLPAARRDWLAAENPDRRWFLFSDALPDRVTDYTCGAFARAVLAVLRSTEGEKP